jgi:GTP-binding protein HflX
VHYLMSTQFKPFIPNQPINTLLVGICAPYNMAKDPSPYYQEFVSLAQTNNLPTDHTLFFRLRTIDSAYFIGKGKLEDIQKYCQEHAIEQVVISEQLSNQQERNLADLLNCAVIDRTELILEIFEKAAHSAEGKLQVEIAAFKHRKSRLAGKGIHMSQQMGTVGFRSGPGETAKERETRYLENMILTMRKKLNRLEKVRETQRKQRVTNRIPLICLIGYTNAGKSTILNTLTKSAVLAEDKLFATLDTTTRELYINGLKKGLLSDTVGFIQNLPHQLIEAFKSTLAELQYADLLLHVIDISNADWENQIKVTLKTLHDIGVDNKPMLHVFNKADLLPEEALNHIPFDQYKPHIIINATNKEGINPLVNFLAMWNRE